MGAVSRPDPQLPGRPERLSPLVQRVLAPNASPYTFTGTQTHLVGAPGTAMAVIDPGPADDVHLDALLTAAGSGGVAAILVTHNHRDHSPGAAPLAARTGAPVIGCAPLEAGPAFDRDYAPDRVLADGEGIDGEGWTLTALATPGHTSNHLCFVLAEEAALFSGDHVMGWSTTVILPPDGSMGAYLASMERLLARDDRVFYPAHGDPIADPRRAVRSQLGHRRFREAQLLRQLEAGAVALDPLVAALYASLDPRLRGAAAATVLAHLIDLGERGLVLEEGGEWRLAR